ncbi:MAG: YbhB/YbcL family Raf kinase inhibitor-like protein [Candidatus Omnitrophica bacterium]|nr:YbhB/YbcL family Raf kinase inhibitor-like protein [Candidatus Omnitrophota bacterium]
MANEKLTVTSAAFDDGGMMQDRQGYNYENVSPQIAWLKTPAGTKSIALICDDPDAPGGDWVHWVIFNIPATAGGLPEGVPHGEMLPDGSIQGVNDFDLLGYDGPAPPSGVHRYIFKVFALDTILGLKPGASKAQLLKAMGGHVLAEGRIVGRFGKE